MIQINKSILRKIKRIVNMDVNQEELDRLEFSLNNFLEDKGELIELTINEKAINIKRNKSMYFIEDVGWTNVLGVYHKASGSF